MNAPIPFSDTPDRLTRRSFLRTAAGGSAAIALAAALPAGCARTYPQAGRDNADLKALTPKEYAVARAAAEALLVGVPVSATTVAKRIDQEVAWVGEPIRTDMKTVLALMEHLTPLGGRVKRFTNLEPKQRLAYMYTWRDSSLQLRRAAYQALKGFVYYFAYIDDATRGLTGFTGPWTERSKLPVKPVDFGEVV
ncbi:MAG TPA: hypothetical protein VFZ04_05860 [Longimicrobiales bacterium]